MWLSDATVVLPDRLIEKGAVRVEAGRIAEIAESPVQGGIPCEGLHLMPGFIDMHGDMIEVELEPRDRVDMPMELALSMLDARLAASGVTTGYAAVSFSKGAKNGARRSFDHTSNVIRALHAARDGLRVDHRIHARFDITFDDAVATMQDLVRDGQVDLVSLMDHTPGQGQYRDIERFVDNMAQREGISEDEARARVETRIAARKRPEEVILANLNAISEVCQASGVSLASHDDDTRKKANLMADIGCRIAEFPVTLEAAKTAVARGVQTAMGAPNALRGTSYSGNLSARQAHAAGLLGMLAADYHPGTMLPAVKILSATDPGGLSGAVRLVSANPADALGLKDRGRIALGLRADLVLADLSGLGRVVASYSAGALAYSNGTIALPNHPEAAAAA
ncbi:MAG: alpha-D-ribose 1-methylphosphonate 5-triphosphate diphosphatase [Pseudomonadota bacterium]